ncbi:MAG: NAD-dependent epimerase/dehydratase family protein [Candidatus Nitrosopumilus sp. bin_6a]
MKVLLTGGTGFIGRNLVSYLKSKKISVDNIDREFLKSDKQLNEYIKSKQSKMKQNYDALVHLAAELDDSSKKLISVNVNLTKRLLKMCLKNQINRFIFASSHLVYGKTEYLPIDENHPTKPKTNYGKSKLMAENFCRKFSNDNDIEVSILRISSVFGNGQNENYVIPRMLNNAFVKNIILHKFSNGFQLMDLVHVDDVSKAILGACRSNKTGIYNLSSGVGITPFELGKTISKLSTGCKISIIHKKQDTNHFLYDVSKIQHELGVKSKINPTQKILKPWYQKLKKSKKSSNSRNINNKRKY